MGITNRTVRECACDKCNRVLLKEADGVAVLGLVFSPFSASPTLDVDKTQTTVWCWACLHKTFSGSIPELDRALARVAELEKSLSRANDEIASLSYTNEGPGPSGPLPPPELPHGVTVVQTLSGARVR